MVIERKHGKLYAEKIHGYGWCITSIIVEDGHRGKGTGSSLMTEAMKRCGRPIYLYASPEFGGDIKRLKSWYRRLGFISYKGDGRDQFPYKFNMILIK